ncbi:MA1C1 mannosidase, partial [Polyodon spathula]|nr:MA1C1 mannosidase [Polyodon spathula]
MFFRKLPGVSASGMGLRLSQKFIFLLFLSGLVTLCFGALFFLPDSARIKRIFLPRSESQTPAVEADTTAKQHSKKSDKSHDRFKGITPAKPMTSAKIKAISQKSSQTRDEKDAEKVTVKKQHNQTVSKGPPPVKPRTVSPFDYEKFRQCLQKPILGAEKGQPSDPQTRERRDKVKEVIQPTFICISSSAA